MQCHVDLPDRFKALAILARASEPGVAHFARHGAFAETEPDAF